MDHGYGRAKDWTCNAESPTSKPTAAMSRYTWVSLATVTRATTVLCCLYVCSLA